MKVRTLVLIAAGLLVVLIGAFAAYISFRATPVTTARPISQEAECVSQGPDADVLVGLGVSGGGSRAALFAAGAFEALGKVRIGPEKRSLLEQVSYISSVSGGSLASSYFVVRKPTHETPVLTRDGTMTEQYQDFFARFKADMARDYEGLLLWRQLSRFRWFNPAWTARSLAEILNEEYLNDIRFEGLARREAQGDSPRLIVNTTLYNNGRRFILSTIPREASQYDVFVDLDRVPGRPKLDPESERVLRARWENLTSLTPIDLNLNVCPVRVAGAVVGSMSFPPVVGPISFQLENQDKYWHVGDGGLADNTGVESLLMMFLKKLQEGKARRTLILMLDSSFPFSVGGEVLDHQAEGFTLLNFDISRIPSIMEERATAYRSWFLRVMQREGLLPDRTKFRVISLKHTDAEWKEDLSDLPESCRKEGVVWKLRKQVVGRLAGVATRLWLQSPCDRDLTLAAAAKVVAQNEGKIRQFLEQ